MFLALHSTNGKVLFEHLFCLLASTFVSHPDNVIVSSYIVTENSLYCCRHLRKKESRHIVSYFPSRLSSPCIWLVTYRSANFWTVLRAMPRSCILFPSRLSAPFIWLVTNMSANFWVQVTSFKAMSRNCILFPCRHLVFRS